MSYVQSPPLPGGPPPLPAFKPGGIGIVYNGIPTPWPQGPYAQSADGNRFTTAEPFTVDDYAIYARCSVATAQAVLDQAVIDGDVLLT